MRDVTPWPNHEYEALQETLRRRSGLIFQPLRRASVESAAARVMQRVGISSPRAFLPLVDQDGAVFDDLMAEVTIGETYFFREAAQFTLLRQTIIPEFRARAAPDQRFRAWSAACSTGEEPYSIALALREEGVAADVVGTDVSRARLAAARRGEYRAWSFRGVPDATIQRYFQHDGDRYTLAADVRRDVDFRYLNLASDRYPSLSSAVWGMDVIFCRNVLIYFDRDTVGRVARSLLASLGDTGWLLLGATDPPLQELVTCEVVQTAAGMAYRHFKGTRFRMLRGVTQPLMPESAPTAQPDHRERGEGSLPRPTPQVPIDAQPTLPLEPPPTPDTPAPLPSVAVVSEVASPTDLYAAHEYDRVIEMIAPLVGADGASQADRVLYVRALANLGRLDEAGRACAAALDRFRDNPELHYLHAVLVAQACQFAESARAAKRAIYLDRSLIVAHLALGSALIRSGDPAGARRAFAAGIRLLSAMSPDAPVPASDGEPAGRLLEMTRLQARLAAREPVAT